MGWRSRRVRMYKQYRYNFAGPDQTPILRIKCQQVSVRLFDQHKYFSRTRSRISIFSWKLWCLAVRQHRMFLLVLCSSIIVYTISRLLLEFKLRAACFNFDFYMTARTLMVEEDDLFYRFRPILSEKKRRRRLSRLS